jgi:hypothetical protein
LIQVLHGVERPNRLPDAPLQAQPLGEPRAVIRLFCTIPHDRVLTVAGKGESELKLSSRSLPSDAGFCGVDLLILYLRSLASVGAATRDHDSAQPSLTVRFDPRLLTDEQLVDIAVESPDAQNPVYRPASRRAPAVSCAHL